MGQILEELSVTIDTEQAAYFAGAVALDQQNGITSGRSHVNQGDRAIEGEVRPVNKLDDRVVQRPMATRVDRVGVPEVDHGRSTVDIETHRAGHPCACKPPRAAPEATRETNELQARGQNERSVNDCRGEAC